jgi:polyphosphate glucokinase
MAARSKVQPENRRMKTLSIDVGGTGLKAALIDTDGNMIGERVKIETPYPCPPEKLVSSLRELADKLAPYDRVSVGFPGLVRLGSVKETPAFSRATWGGPPDPQLVQAWAGFELEEALQKVFGHPTRVANDADLQGSAAVKGDGFEFVMTLGTGCGTAVFWQGDLLPHMELSHGPFRKGETFDIQLGDAARHEIGNHRWRSRVRKAIAAFDEMLVFDHLYVGGGNARHLKDEDFPAKATMVPNIAGLLGGIRLWDQPWETHHGHGM